MQIVFLLLPLVLVPRVPEAGPFTFLQENQPSSQAAASATAEDLTRERSLLGEVKAALKSADYEQARAMVQEAVTALLARPAAEQSSEWLALLDDAAHAAHDARELHGEKAALERLLEVRSRSLPEEAHELQRTRSDLAMLLLTLGDPVGARPLLEQALEVFLRTLPADHFIIQITRGNLATTIRELGELEEARALGEEAVEALERTRPVDDAYLQSARMALAGTIYRQGDYEGAQAIMEKVLASYSRTLPEDALDLQRARGNLGVTLSSLGDEAGARVLKEKVLEALSRMLPDDSPDLQLARMNLATTIHELGDPAGARPLLEKVLEIDSRTLPEDNADLQRARINFANILSSLGDWAGARALDEKVLDVRMRTMPEDHGELQHARTCLAADLWAMGEYAKARALYEKALEVYARTLPEEHQLRQETRANLALTIASLGDLQKARAIQEEVLALYTRTMSDGDPALQRARGYLTKTIIEQAARARRGAAGVPVSEATRADEGRCAELIAALCRGAVQAARAALLSGSSREAEERCAQLAKELDLSISLASGYGVFQPHAELDRESFVLGETTRGAALTSAALMRMARSSPRYAETRRALWQASDELAQLAQEGTTNDEFQRALRKREGLERELVSLAQELSGDGQVRLVFDPEALTRELGEHDAIVGLRHYVHTSFETEERPDPAGDPSPTKTSVESLCAFVLRSPVHRASSATGSLASSEPTEPFRLTRIELGPSAPIEQAVHAWRDAIGARLERGLSTSDSSLTTALQRGQELRRLVFDPLLAALGDASHVIFALDDELHLVPLEALPLDVAADGLQSEPELVGERWRIETHTTLAELVTRQTPLIAGANELIAIGGAAFNSEPIGLSADDTAAVEETLRTPDKVSILMRGGVWSRGFSPLPYTGMEARGVAQLHEEVFEDAGARQVLEKRKASREALEEVAPRARWLHIATHGWFAPESIRSWVDPEPIDEKTGLGVRLSGDEQVRGLSPMLLCGLALAGANLPENAVGRVPGLVTAQELSALDLTNCELVVLSACDTNVGEQRAGQGVASLQKALQMAGARSVITSLWKVPDEATKELMLDFYRRLWVERKPKGQALWEAKMRLRGAKDERGEPKYTLRDWAAWVLTGDPQ